MKFSKMALIFGLVMLAAAFVYQDLAQKNIDSGMDIYYSWVEGERLLQGENPYARILSGNMRENDKYATYFPLFYLLSWASQSVGFLGLPAWLSLWRVVFIIFDCAIAGVIYYYYASKNYLVLALLGALFWLFNRWSLYQVRVAYFDFIPIFFMLLSLVLFPRRRVFSFLLMSVSLAFKQMAIFLLPLYLIWVWQNTVERRWKQILMALVWLALVPVLTSLPFLVWNAEGFVRSVFFSVTRDAADQFGAATLAVRMNWDGLPARLPMLLMMALVYLAAWKKQLKKFTAALLVMLMFVEFNPVQFRQYFSWLMVFLPFIIKDVSPNVTSPQAQTDLAQA